MLLVEEQRLDRKRKENKENKYHLHCWPSRRRMHEAEACCNHHRFHLFLIVVVLQVGIYQTIT